MNLKNFPVIGRKKPEKLRDHILDFEKHKVPLAIDLDTRQLMVRVTTTYVKEYYSNSKKKYLNEYSFEWRVADDENIKPLFQYLVDLAFYKPEDILNEMESLINETLGE